MVEWINHFPTVLLTVMMVLTLVLLPLLNEERPQIRDDRQRTEELRLSVKVEGKRERQSDF
ncbi:MAG: hypothetical protein RMK84_18945 [Oscillochloridaceae bacterium]|nr:hypothetical protein [Chloroflexaceae bacterium]MDW8392203.1 hypothetical protein [Oscillochloridaceae bacterium]